MAPFRSVFKNKLRLSRTAPNALLANHAIYNFRNMFEVQLQAQFSNFIVQLNNSNLLGQITLYRLAHIQLKEGLNTSPLLAWDKLFPAKRYKTSFIPNVMDLLHRFQLSVQVAANFQNKIKGGCILLRDVLGFHFVPYQAQIVRMGLVYLDQITTPNGLFLDTWQDLRHKTFSQNIRLSNAVP